MAKTRNVSGEIRYPGLSFLGLFYGRRVMFLSIVSGLQHWAMQIQRILIHKMDHLSPQDYCVMLVFAIAIGYCLLKGQNI